MVTPDDLDRRLNTILSKPLMWAVSAESLEGQVLQLLWVRGDKFEHKDYLRFVLEYFSPKKFIGSIAAWAQVDISVEKMAEILRSFIYKIECDARENKK